MKLTKKQAKEPSIEKWEMTVEADGNVTEEILTRFQIYLNGCAYCEKYYYTCSEKFDYCFKCPIRPKISEYDDISDAGCCQECHPYIKWQSDQTKENAQAVLDLIKES